VQSQGSPCRIRDGQSAIGASFVWELRSSPTNYHSSNAFICHPGLDSLGAHVPRNSGSSDPRKKPSQWSRCPLEKQTVAHLKSSMFWDITPCSPLKSTDVSEEHIASIFRVKE
jgi:hypothetical protein